jgi:PAS domain S-box-containing protein
LKPKRRAGFELRLALMAGLAVLPLLLALLAMLLLHAVLWWHWAVYLGLPVLLTAALAVLLRRQLVYPLRTVATLLEALRQGDFSFRGARAKAGDALGDVVLEINQLADTLRANRLKTEETLALLRRVLDSIDIAIFAFDEEGRLRLINPAGERLLGRTDVRLLSCTAAELGMHELLEGAPTRTLELALDTISGRFELRRASFREGGSPQSLVVLTDLSRALREEERQAFKRLVRVFGHELNNSLAPIKSMAATLASLLSRDPLPGDWREDATQVLDVIADRSDSLARFLGAYSQLARLPAPVLRPVQLHDLLAHAVRMETRLPVQLLGAPELQLELDVDQLEQALINLLRNAAEASLSRAPDPLGAPAQVWMQAQLHGKHLQILIDDNGPGIAATENLFVPFFTTKPGGSGVGLVLARQVVEGHGGSLTLRNRSDSSGCRVTVSLPL